MRKIAEGYWNEVKKAEVKAVRKCMSINLTIFASKRKRRHKFSRTLTGVFG